MHDTTPAPMSARAHLGTEPALTDVAREDRALALAAGSAALLSVAALVAAVFAL